MATFNLPQSADSTIAFRCDWDCSGDRFELYVKNQAGTAQFSYTGRDDFDIDADTVRVYLDNADMATLTASTVPTTSAAGSDNWYYIELVGYDALGRRYVLSSNNPLRVYAVANYIYQNPKVSLSRPEDFEVAATYFDYFIDSYRGDDGNNGTTPLTAKATVSSTQTAAGGTFPEGTKIGLKRGGYWEEEVRLHNDLCVVAAYGCGVRPILDARDYVGNLSSYTGGGATNTYSVSHTFDDAETGITCTVGVWQVSPNRRLELGSGASALNEGEYYIADPDTSPQTIYVKGWGLADPDTVRISTRHGCVHARAANGNFTNKHLVRGIEMRAGTGEDGPLVLGKNCEVHDCDLSEGAKHLVVAGSGCDFYDTTFGSFYFNSTGGNPFTIYSGVGEEFPSTIKNCVFNHGGGDYPLGSQSAYIFCHIGTSGRHGPTTFDTCTFYGATDFNGDTITLCTGVAAEHTYFNNCTVTGGFVQMWNLLAHPTTIDGCTINVDVASSSVMRLATKKYSWATFKNNKVCITSPGTSSGLLLCNQEGSDMFVTGNDFYLGNTSNKPTLAYHIGDNGTLTFSNNRVHAASDKAEPIFVGLTSHSVTLTTSGNTYKFNDFDYRDKFDATYGTLALWQAAGYDTDATVDGTLDLSTQCA